MTHTETINGQEVIFETAQVAERLEHSTEYFMYGYTGDKLTHTAIGSFAIGSDDFEEISYIEEVEERNMYQELHDLVHDLQGNLGDIVDGVSNFIEENYSLKNK